VIGAGAWFRDFAELLERIEVTDASGARQSLDDGAARAIDRILEVRQTRNKVLLVGNGGSAAIVSHMHSDLAKSVGVRALVFHDIPLLTATVNDDGYEQVFSQPMTTWLDPGDLLIVVSSSGRSPNILNALKAASAAGVDVITLSGFEADNPLRGGGAVNFWVSSKSYGLVEGVHTAISHYLTDAATARVLAEQPA
jgi:D-sedoheptulose 7-phosphate isomerase